MQGRKTLRILQKKRMLAKMTSIIVMETMSNHVFKQQDGGPIGDELAQALASLTMIWWDNEFLTRCEKLKIDILMYERYVDDVDTAVIPPPLGSRLSGGKLVVAEEKVREDEARPRDRVTAELLRNVANNISPMIQMKEEVGSDHPEDD